ncbi:MAG TPA: MarR family winged helix-turn-helix transcriptional regulator [Polaromonas sp.]
MNAFLDLQHAFVDLGGCEINWRASWRTNDAELGKAGLRTTQYWLLTEVLSNGPVRPCDLAEAMSLSPSTLTRSLKPLIVTGWLALGPGIDGRTRSVSITAAGRRKSALSRRTIQW